MLFINNSNRRIPESKLESGQNENARFIFWNIIYCAAFDKSINSGREAVVLFVEQMKSPTRDVPASPENEQNRSAAKL